MDLLLVLVAATLMTPLHDCLGLLFLLFRGDLYQHLLTFLNYQSPSIWVKYSDFNPILILSTTVSLTFMQAVIYSPFCLILRFIHFFQLLLTSFFESVLYIQISITQQSMDATIILLYYIFIASKSPTSWSSSWRSCFTNVRFWIQSSWGLNSYCVNTALW